MTAPIASGWSESPGGPCTHWKAPPFHGARRNRPFQPRSTGAAVRPYSPPAREILAARDPPDVPSCCRGDASAGRLSRRANRLRASSRIRLDTEMVGKLSPSEAIGKALRVERQHGRVPCVPLRDQPIIDVAMPVLEVRSLHRILDHVEKKGVVEDLEVFPVAISCR